MHPCLHVHTLARAHTHPTPTCIVAGLGVWRSFTFIGMSVCLWGMVEGYLHDASPSVCLLTPPPFVVRLFKFILIDHGPLSGCGLGCTTVSGCLCESPPQEQHRNREPIRHSPKYIQPTVSEHPLCSRHWGFRDKSDICFHSVSPLRPQRGSRPHTCLQHCMVSVLVVIWKPL